MKIAILGAGSWAIALGNLLSESGQAVTLWEPDQDAAHMIDRLRQNWVKLPGVVILPEVTIEWELGKVISGADYVIVALPSWAVSGTLCSIRAGVSLKVLKAVRGWIIASRGIELDGLALMSEVFETVMPAALHDSLTVLAGPAHAEEVCKGSPTTLVVAGTDELLTKEIQTVLSQSPLRIYTSADLRGVQLGACFSDVISIAVGLCDGLGYGDNTRGALLARGLAEACRLGVALGGWRQTFSGLSVAGELTACCMSPYSPNRLAGLHVGRGMTLSEAVCRIPKIVEGLDATIAVNDLASKLIIDTPIARAVYEVLFQRTSPTAAAEALMTRAFAAEE
ncbi:MAG TPA: NAD(P)H-dependent glycerol-3-phosphate dehydrogenase [Tepidisphaeraceae bacterium]|nr:NAD(P)H-dependent glycerol-3-phosphate dehydrogenase [Tepidisphaeraceae bacterium]